MVRKVQPTDLSSTWKHTLEQDGWYRAHDALRADFAALQQMLGCFAAQLGEGRPLTRPQATAAGRFFAAFLKFLHHHHHNEDDIAVPYLKTRCQMPEKIAADHAQLDALLDRMEQQMGRLLSPAAVTCIQQRPLLEAVADTFAELHPMCLRHFAEEEAEAMPLMRRHFTPEEISKHVVAKIARSMDSTSVGVMLRPMTRKQRVAFAKQEQIPFFIRWLFLRMAAKHERTVWRPFERECLRASASA
ncbi:hypothetical protein ABPG77_007136 [Micractinium sp. CCAP 211/92]